MSHGYSQLIISANKEADKRLLGVALGRACIAHNVSAAAIAKRFKVSRQTVYNWFCGTHNPRPEQSVSIERYLALLTK